MKKRLNNLKKPFCYLPAPAVRSLIILLALPTVLAHAAVGLWEGVVSGWDELRMSWNEAAPKRNRSDPRRDEP